MFFKKEKNKNEEPEKLSEVVDNHVKDEQTPPDNGSLNKQELEEKIIQGLKTCYDPEIPVDIFELGLIYEIRIDNDANVNIKMTLTSPACPVAGSLPGEVEMKIKSIAGVKNVNIELVWNPPWDRDMMSDVAKVELGMY